LDLSLDHTRLYKVFATPLLTAVVGWGGLKLAHDTTEGNLWFAVMCGGVWTLTLIIATVMGPSYQRWRLTASARTGQPIGSGKLFEKI